MKWLYALALPGAMCAAAIGDDKPAEGKHMEDVARGYVDAFLQGNAQALLDHASPELRALVKDPAALNSLRKNTVGARPVSADEQISVEYVRLVKSAAGQTWSVAATVAPDGTLAGFLVTPAGEAPSTFLNYKTKAHARLPFAGTWTVFWGGRSIKDNYHAAYPDQRFAYDIVMMKDGKTHPGNGAKNEDYYCYGQTIVSPAAGLVAAVTDGIADNRPGRMNSAKPTGNHIVLDLGNDEYMFLCHFQNGSIKVKLGDRVRPAQPLGLCGNSGNSSEPHLHIHLQTTPKFGAGKGLPLQFQHYEADGKAVNRGEPTKGQRIRDVAAG